MNSSFLYDKNKILKNRPLVVLTGPTAVGKTKASIGFAKVIGGEIISADSMQVYRGMDIGSAKIKKEEMEGVPHHLIDVLNPDEECNVMIFQKMAKAAIEEIYDRGHIPIITGGTGFYIQSVLYDISFAEEADNSIRKELEEMAEKEGPQALYDILVSVDPEYAASLHANNVKRVIRAIEFYKVNGYPLSKHNETEHEKESPYMFRYYVLDLPREILYERIEKRIDNMLVDGLVEEVSTLKKQGFDRSFVSMQGLGYKEILDVLDQKCTLEEAVSIMKRYTRHFAKRQLTWFRREKEVTWVKKGDYTDEDALCQWLVQDYYKHIGSRLE